MEREYRITNTDLLVTSILLSKKAPQDRRAIFSWGGRGRGSGSESARLRRLRESDKVDYVK